jgi:two-component system response regulator PilR (NtrC family)
MTARLRILIVEDSTDRLGTLRRVYSPHDVVIADSVADAKARLAAGPFDIVSLDFDLGDGGQGDDIARYLAGQEHVGMTVIVHSMNPDGVKAIKAILPDAVELPVSLLERGTSIYGRLRAELALCRKIDWAFVLAGKR